MLLFEEAPSVPRHMFAPARASRSRGAIPEASLWLLMEQWATLTPLSAMIEMSFGESQTQWAATTRSLRKPRESKYSTGLLLQFFSKLSTSDLVSERWMWSITSYLSASSRARESVSSEQV